MASLKELVNVLPDNYLGLAHGHFVRTLSWDFQTSYDPGY